MRTVTETSDRSKAVIGLRCQDGSTVLMPSRTYFLVRYLRAFWHAINGTKIECLRTRYGFSAVEPHSGLPVTPWCPTAREAREHYVRQTAAAAANAEVC